MANVVACKQVGGAPAQVNGTGNATHNIRWKAEFDEAVSGAEAIILCQNTTDDDHDPVAKLGDPFTQLGFTDFGALALDINAEPQSSATNRKWDIQVTFRPPEPGDRETPADIAFFNFLRDQDVPDFTSVADLQQHDANFPLERWVEYQQFDQDIDQGFRVQNPTDPPADWVLENQARPIRNLVGDPFPTGTRYSDSLTRLILVTERFVGSPISALWLNTHFFKTFNETQFGMSRDGKFVNFGPGEARFLEARTGRAESYQNRFYYRCRSEVEIGNIFDTTFAVFEQRGTRARDLFDGQLVDVRTTDITGQIIPHVPLQPNGQIADDPNDQAPDDIWALNAPGADYQTLIGPAEQPTLVLDSPAWRAHAATLPQRELIMPPRED